MTKYLILNNKPTVQDIDIAVNTKQVKRISLSPNEVSQPLSEEEIGSPAIQKRLNRGWLVLSEVQISNPPGSKRSKKSEPEKINETIADKSYTKED